MCIRDSINTEQQTFDGEKETIVKVFNIMKSRSDLEVILNRVKQHQKEDKKLNQIRERLDQQEERATHFYCLHEDILFIKTKPNQNTWKLIIPKGTEAETVSYTHLDVYKRQVLPCVRI